VDASRGLVVIVPLVACASSAALTAWSIRYAHRRALIDHPGQRRSHRVPTPRGGGIGIVATVLAGLLVAAATGTAASTPVLAVAAAIALVGAVGWIDDHGGLAARWRFAAHLLAALSLFAPAVLPQPSDFFGAIDVRDTWPLLAVAATFACLLVVWSINLHNFMDGIDGLLAMQAIFVFVVAAAAFLAAGRGAAGIGALACMGATAGFLPFNFPRARIFMGDVGSGVLGLLVGIAVLGLLATPRIAPATGAIACSAFVADATCTLLSRMLRGRRWYSAHREHLYQWLVRSGFSHARVVALYTGWNVLIALPVILWINRPPDSAAGIPSRDGIGAAAVLYVAAVLAWWLGKRWCLHAAMRRKHAS